MLARTALAVCTLLALNAAAAGQGAIELTAGERAWLDAHPRIRVAPDPDFPPYEFFDDDGDSRGIAADYLQLIEARLGIEFEVARLEDWDAILAAAQAREIDLFGAAVETPQRARYMNFTVPHIRQTGIILVRRDRSGAVDLRDLYAKKVAVVSGYVWQDLLANDHPAIDLVPAHDTATALQMVSFGIVDAMVSDQATAVWFIEQEGLNNLRVAGRAGYESSMSIAVRSDWPELRDILDKALASISAQERTDINRAYIALEVPSVFARREFWIGVVIVGAVVFAVFGVFLGWNRMLQRQVDQRTAELREHRDQLEETVAERTRDLRLAMQDAESANRAKSEFLSNMSHELRTPLNGVLGYAQLLIRDRSMPGEHRDSLGAIESCGEHLLTLINDVLDLSKIEAGRLELAPVPCDLHRLLHNVFDIVRPRAESKGLECRLDVSPEVPVGVVTDDTKLKQTLVNLLGNAVKFTDAGTVTLQVREIAEGDFEFRIRDTGLGMTPEEMERIFDPFRQAEGGKVSGGTGLGLPISRRIVEAQGGTLTVQSEKGAGSCFTVRLPMEEVLDETVAVDRASLSGARDPVLPEGYAADVLIVDDNAENRDMLTKLMRSIGFGTDAVEEGGAALRAMREKDYRLVLMDLRMPGGMNGVEATRRIRADEGLRDVVILAVTASVFPEFRAQAQDVGFDDFIPKPLHVTELLVKIARHLEIEFADRVLPGEVAGAVEPAAPVDLAPEVIARLHEAVRLRNMTALTALAAEIGESGGSAVAEQIMGLTRSFDFAGLGRLIGELQR